MVSDKLWLIPKVIGDRTHAIFWSATVLKVHYYDYFYTHLMRVTLYEETLQAKEAHKRLLATHWDRFCTYMADNGRFLYPQCKEAVQTCDQQISYYGVGSHHKNTIVKIRIKELTLCGWTLLLQVTILWPEAVITILWPLSLKKAFQRYNSLEMNEDGKTPA